MLAWILRPIRGLALAALVLSAACRASDRLTAVPTDAACSGGASLKLALLAAATLDCSAGTTVTLSGDGATYLVALQLAVGDVASTPIAYTVSVPGSAVLAAVPARRAPVAPFFALLPSPASSAHDPRPDFDAGLRAYGAAMASRGLATESLAPAALAAAAAGHGVKAAAAIPEVGSTRDFQVLATTDFANVRYASVSARLAYVGSNVLLYEDVAAPAGGFTNDELARVGRYFDEVLYPLDINAFGPPSDIDGNGRLIMVLSPVVNALATKAACASRYIAGFFNPGDLSGAASSNHGEVFYAVVPDPAGTVSCPHGVADAEALLGSTFLHETQHLISYGQHVLVHHGKVDAGWLDEGLSLVAEELGSSYYEAKYPGSAGRTQRGQLLPDSAQPFMNNILTAAYAYLLRQDTATLTTHSDADGGAAWRGGDWLLLRWLGDQKGGYTFFRAVEQTSATGVAAIEAAAGERLGSLFGDFALALYADSLVAVPRSAIPVRNTVPSRNLRKLLTAYAGDYPLEPLPLTGTTTATIPPGGSALYRVSTKVGSGGVKLRFSDPSGAPLPANLRPQVAIFRLPGA